MGLCLSPRANTGDETKNKNARSRLCRNPGEGTPLYKLYRYVPSQRVWFLSRFGLKTGIDFDHYGLKSSMVFEGTTGAYKRICLFNAK